MMTTSSTSEVCRTVGVGQDCFNRTETKASYRAAGFALAGASLAAGVIDWIMTSGKSSAVPAPSGRGGNGLDLLPSADGAGVTLLRIRF
jgi:hypothetical protein